MTLVLRDAICHACQDRQDLDLCRDPAVGCDSAPAGLLLGVRRCSVPT